MSAYYDDDGGSMGLIPLSTHYPRRVFLTVSYDGTRFHGSALSKSEPCTIEAALNDAICAVAREDVAVIGASRTDAGVHAKGAVFVFDTLSKIPPSRFAVALNSKLPPDIRIQESHEVSTSFHPRKVQSRKTYLYRIMNSPFEDPLRSRYAWFVPRKLDLQKMCEAAKPLVGTHDFTSFCNVNSTALTRVRTIYELTVAKKDDEIHITVTGNGFLYNMVRIIAGTLAQIGWGWREPNDMKEILSSMDRGAAGLTAPSKGLTMMSYTWEDGI